MKAAAIRGTLVLAALVAFTASSFAASTVRVQVVENDVPLEAVSVNVLASNGTFADITDGNGEISLDISGQYFRLVVNGVTLDGGYEATGQMLVIDVAN